MKPENKLPLLENAWTHYGLVYTANAFSRNGSMTPLIKLDAFRIATPNNSPFAPNSKWMPGDISTTFSSCPFCAK